jgi:methionyl-tRNA synthetase
MDISTAGNQLLQNNEPWKNQKSNPEMVKVVLNLGLHYVIALSVAMRPFLPFTSAKLQKILNLAEIQERGELVELLDKLAEGELLIDAGHTLHEAHHLFSRIDDTLILKQMDKLHKPMELQDNDESAISAKYHPLKETITYEDFIKTDLRTAKILSAEKVAKADKLLKLELDLGFEKRTVVSGIALHYSPEEIIGKQVLVLANLAPRTLKGIESNGMILMAEDADGKLNFVQASPDWPLGSIVK